MLLSADGSRTPGTAALFAAVGKTFTLELPDGSTGKVVVQGLKRGKGGVVLAFMGQDATPF